MRLMKLEFQGPEMEFLQKLNLAEQTLTEEETALQDKANVKEILRKHKVRLKNCFDIVFFSTNHSKTFKL